LENILEPHLFAYAITPALDRSRLPDEPTWLSRKGTVAKGSRGKSGNSMGKRLLIYFN